MMTLTLLAALAAALHDIDTLARDFSDKVDHEHN